MKQAINKRLLKKLTPIDYLLLFVIVVAVSIAIIFFSRQKSVVYVYTVNEFPEWQENPFPPLYWISNSIQKGDAAYDSTGKKIAEVISVDNTEWGGQRRYSRLKLKVHALFDKRTKRYRVRDQPLQVGNTLLLDIGNTKYEGVISYIGEALNPPDDQHRRMELEIKAFEVSPWLADTYDETFVVKNTEGEEIFRITDSIVVPTEKSVETAAGSIVRSRDPYFKDVYITAIVEVRCQVGVCYYNETIPVKIGRWIWVQTETSFIEGSARILSIKDIDNEK